MATCIFYILLTPKDRRVSHRNKTGRRNDLLFRRRGDCLGTTFSLSRGGTACLLRLRTRKERVARILLLPRPFNLQLHQRPVRKLGRLAPVRSIGDTTKNRSYTNGTQLCLDRAVKVCGKLTRLLHRIEGVRMSEHFIHA